MFTYDGLTIRTVEDSDLEQMRALRNDPLTWTMLSDVGFIDAEAQRLWFQQIRLTHDRQYYVICNDGFDFIGIVRTDQLDHVNRSMRIGADIVKDLRGRGYGTKTYGLLKKYCFDYLNMHRIWLAVLDNNEIAINLYKQQGFRVEGRYREAIFRDGSYHDYIIMSILESEYRGNGTRE